MKVPFILAVLISLFSCSFLVEDEILLILPYETRLESITGESPYYILQYFDGYKVSSLYIPMGTYDLHIKVRKASLAVFSLQPVGYYSSFGAYYEPGSHKTVHFNQEDGDFCSFLIDIASYNARPVANLSLSSLKRLHGDFYKIDKEIFLNLLEAGALNGASAIKAKEQAVVLENLPSGLWESDKWWIGDIHVENSGEEIHLDLYEGTYLFLNIDRNMLLILLVMKDEKHTMKIEKLRAWY